MFHARVKDKATGRERLLHADEFAAIFARAGTAGGHDIFTPDGELPLHFRPSGRRREGNTLPPRRPHFAHMPGEGSDDHVFDKGRITQSFNDAVAGGAVVLLNLNRDLSYRDLDCTTAAAATAEGGMTYHDWRAAYAGHYRTVSIGTIREAITTIRRVKDLVGGANGEFRSRIFAHYGGGVLPYDAFFLPAAVYKDVPAEKRNGSALPDLFNRLQGAAGVKIENGAARAIGMPRLLQFLPTDAMKRQQSPREIRGTHVSGLDEGVYLFSQMIFSGDEGVRASTAFRELVQHVQKNPHGVWVLASPSVTLYEPGERAEHKGMMLRWIINDIGAQTIPVGEVSKTAPAPQPV